MSIDIARMTAYTDKTSCTIGVTHMNNVASVLKVKTAKMVFWVVSGTVTIAKCAKTGRFIKRDDAQWLFDNLTDLSQQISINRFAGNRVCDAYKELTKSIAFFGLSLFNDDTAEQFKKLWLGILNQTSDHRWDDKCPMIAA